MAGVFGGMTRDELMKTPRGAALRRCDSLWAELNRCPQWKPRRRARLRKLHARAWKRFLLLGARSLVVSVGP